MNKTMKKILTTVCAAVLCIGISACAPFTVDMAESRMEKAGYTVTLHSETEAEILMLQDIEGLESAFTAVKDGEMFIALYFESFSAAKKFYDDNDGINEATEVEGRWVFWGTDAAKEDFKKLF